MSQDESISYSVNESVRQEVNSESVNESIRQSFSQMKKVGKFLKKLLCCVDGRV